MNLDEITFFFKMTLKGCHCPDVIKKDKYILQETFSNRIGVCNAYVVSFLEKKDHV